MQIRHLHLFALVLASCAAGLMPPCAFAADRDWQGTDGDWWKASNWYPNAVPSVADDVYIYTYYPPYLSSGAAKVSFLDVDYSGQLIISGGASLEDKEGDVGYSGYGTVDLSGAGTKWTNSVALFVAGSGLGYVNISSGAMVTSASTVLGDLSGGQGLVSIAGANSVFHTTDGLFVGDAGYGSLSISSGGAAASGYAYVGNLAGSTGSVSVTGTDSYWISGATVVGDEGTGMLLISDGGVVSNNAVEGIQASAGYASTGTGTITITGPGSAYYVSGELMVGESGKGTVTVADGGLLDVGDSGHHYIELAKNAGSQGTLNVGTGGAAGSLSAWGVNGGAGSAKVIFDHNQTFNMSVPLLGSLGVTQIGTGTTILSAANTYTGGTTISAGTLKLGNAGALGTGDVTVGAAGRLDVSEVNYTLGAGRTLSGGGEVLGDLAVAGTLTPGATGAAGRLAVTGGLTLESTSQLFFGLGGTAAGIGYDQIAVTGSLSLGGTLSLSLIDGFEGSIMAANIFDIFTAGSTSGFFTGLTSGGRVLTSDGRGSFQITRTATGIALGDYQFVRSDHSAAILTASDGAADDYLGRAVSLSGNIGLVGAYGDDDKGDNSGSAYVFRNLDTATGTITQSVKLTVSDGAAGDFFGYAAVSLSGNVGLVGADSDNNSGAAYVFRNLDTSTGTITQSAKLTASDRATSDYFGRAVSLSGNIGLVGAYLDDDKGSGSGSAYVFRNLNTVTGTITQNAKLTASDGAAGDYFGYAVSLSKNIGLVGAYRDDDKGSDSGSAYVFRNLDTVTGTITQSAKLLASDGAASDNFGYSVSLSGNIGLVGAYVDDNYKGAAYVFRDLDTATGTITQNVKLIASDGGVNDNFGYSVSLSGNTGLVGAYRNAAYVFRNLDTATGTVSESLKLLASDGAASNAFGYAVSLDGDNFIIGAYGANNNTGKAYNGTVSSMTLLDWGHASRVIDGISFVSKEDWIIGQSFSENIVTLTTGDTANVTSSGKAVFIGQNAGSDRNVLIVDGTLNANTIQIGGEGTTGNTLQIGEGGTVTGNITLNHGTLDVTAAGYTLGAGRTLSGIGEVLGDLTVASTLSPGATGDTGRISITGGLTLASTSQLIFQIGGTGAGSSYDQIAVGGTLALGGGLTLSFTDNFQGNITATDTFDILTAGSTSGFFTGLANGGRILSEDGRGSFMITSTVSGVTLSDYQFIPSVHTAAILTASDRAAYDYFGASVSLSGNIGLVGADHNQFFVSTNSATYVFRNLDTATGTITQNVKLTAAGGTVDDNFGGAVSLSGNIGLIGANFGNGKATHSGAAYVFRNLDTATGTITQSVKLTASDGVASDEFGGAVSLSGNVGLVGADGDDSYKGGAYLFRNLSTATGTITQNAKLTASDGAAGDYFGRSVSLSGSIGLVGAPYDDDRGINAGAAYAFRNLDTATGTITQSVKLTASDGALDDNFGQSVSLSGYIGLAGAWGDDSGRGAAYLFRNLDTATGTITQNAKLTASDRASGDYFGWSVSQSGNIGIVGAYGDDDKGSSSGAAYVFRNLDTATGTIIQNVKLTASDGTAGDSFGYSVSLDSDNFLIGAQGKDSARGKAYSGSVSSMTTLDMGHASREIDGISFVSREDWIIGQTRDANTVTLTAGDTANVTASGKAVYIGQQAGSDNNTLDIAGTLTTTTVYIGSVDGNTGNTLVFESTASFSNISLYLADSNSVLFTGHFTDIGGFLDSFGSHLYVFDDSAWILMTGTNFTGMLDVSYDGTYTSFTANAGAVPEPCTWALIGLGLASLLLRRRRAVRTNGLFHSKSSQVRA